jgi:hypothetical protein
MKIIFAIGILSTVGILATTAQTDIHGVDFKNFTYSAYCVSDKPQRITVTDGSFQRKSDDDPLYFDVRGDIEYGDLDGDGKDEAVIVSVCNTGGTGQFTEGFVYTMKAGKPALLARIPGGDRAEGGLVRAWVENGLLLVKANDADRTSGACCPEYTLTSKYKIIGPKLVETGKGVREEIYKRERLTFERGKSGTSFTVKIDSYDKRRYTVGAGPNQYLLVTVDKPGVEAGLLGDLESNPLKNGFDATLRKKADYTFEIANNTETAQQITVSVTIK